MLLDDSPISTTPLHELPLDHSPSYATQQLPLTVLHIGPPRLHPPLHAIHDASNKVHTDINMNFLPVLLLLSLAVNRRYSNATTLQQLYDNPTKSTLQLCHNTS
ncbi:hypothetical protein Pcinc_018464 [Petrolisthes cinctipes]|uniref:Uncharacterized protein n=1 Tax=Petrolisthes cinctipes TaxID=88211 RepID=A0AAE1FP33_PETCI|nr:hypothetical protein Pcinc_018464 [Petrolisthes cinctipes]